MTSSRANPELLTEIRRYGKFDVNGCFSCGTCTLSCDLTTEHASFPRRLMRYVQLGLRDEVLGSLEPWLCYYCGDCSEVCPRQADPAESLMTLRRYLPAQYDWTGLSRKIYQSRVWEVGALVVVAAIVFLLGYAAHRPGASAWLQPLLGADLLATHPCLPLLVAFDWLVLFLIAFFVAVGAGRMYWLTVGRSGLKVPLACYFSELKTFFFHASAQVGFRRCAHNERRWGTHLALASGCTLMFVLVFFFLDWLQTDKLYPLYHPQRLLGYFATAAILFGAGDALVGRIRKREPMHSSSALGDWLLPALLLLVALSGILIHICRYAGLELRAYDFYAAHMVVTVPVLLVEVPFGKSTHMFYRPLALYFQGLKARALAAADTAAATTAATTAPAATAPAATTTPVEEVA